MRLGQRMSLLVSAIPLHLGIFQQSWLLARSVPVLNTNYTVVMKLPAESPLIAAYACGIRTWSWDPC